MKQLNTAIRIAAVAHDGQFDKGGHPYCLHPLKVMHYLKSTDQELMSIAVLHDVVEDTSVTYAYLLEEGLSERVIEGVRCVTKVPGETKQEYRARVMSNLDAVRVKMADLRHNSDIRRLKGVTDKDIARVVEYQKFYTELKAHLEANA
jgi:(p)ppGpp synthase/HD superfamily hydrolase